MKDDDYVHEETSRSLTRRHKQYSGHLKREPKVTDNEKAASGCFIYDRFIINACLITAKERRRFKTKKFIKTEVLKEIHTNTQYFILDYRNEKAAEYKVLFLS